MTNMSVNVDGKANSAIEGCGKNNPSEMGRIQNNDKLVKFFEILMQIDQCQKNNQKRHRGLDSTS